MIDRSSSFVQRIRTAGNFQDEDLGLQQFGWSIYFISFLLIGNILYVRGIELDKPQFWLNLASFGAFTLLMVFYSRFTVRNKVLLMTILCLLPATWTIQSIGLLSIIRVSIILAPLMIALAFPISRAMAVLGAVILLSLFGAYGFVSGRQPIPDLSPLKTGSYIPIDALTILILTLSFSSVLLRMRKGLVNNLRSLNDRNKELREEERTLQTIMEQLDQSVAERIVELEQARKDLMESQDSLKAQHQVYSTQQQNLEKTHSAIKETQAELVQSRKLASIGSLSLGIAHEINNPLNFITGSLRLLGKKATVSSDPDLLKLTAIMEQSAATIGTVVTALTEYGNTEEVVNKSCDLHKIILQCEGMLRSQLSDDCRLIIHAPDFPCLIAGNPGKLLQVFTNLIHNSIQAISATGLIEVRFSKNGNEHYRITVKDNGSGIPAEIIGRITEAFFTTKAMGKGTGLGLYFTRQIVEQHKGRLTFHSAPGQGTEAVVELPASFASA